MDILKPIPDPLIDTTAVRPIVQPRAAHAQVEAWPRPALDTNNTTKPRSETDHGPVAWTRH